MKQIPLTILFLSFSFLLLIGCKNENSNNENKEPIATNEQNQSEGWQNLLNGQDLSGWRVLGSDKAKFYVEEGVLIGETQKGIPNSFLATTYEYDDFELELEFKVDPSLNSGVQIRSGVYDEQTTTPYISGKLEESERTWEKGRVHGYQVEIDPSDRAWSGGFYEEGGRGWLQPLTGNDQARSAYSKDGWNKFRIVADGDHFQTWINDKKAVDTRDDKRSSGFIALQLHSVSRDDQVGKKIMFRDIRVKELNK